MKSSLQLVCALVLVFFSSCTSAPDPSKLLYGMSKEDVIKVMGKPMNELKEGEKEVLFYRLQTKRDVSYEIYSQPPTNQYATTNPTPRPTRHVDADSPAHPFYKNPSTQAEPYFSGSHTINTAYNETKKYAVILNAGKVEAFGNSLALREMIPAAAKASLSIASVSPDHATPGQRTDFTLAIDYTLPSDVTDGSIEITVRTADSYNKLTTKKVRERSGRIDIAVTLSAKELMAAKKLMFRARLADASGPIGNFSADTRKELPLVKP